MRFYLDEDLSKEVAEIARGSGVDVVSSHECGRNGLGDMEQLRLAAGEERCLVTCNRADFMNLTLMFFEHEWPHAGVLVVTPILRVLGAARIATALVDYDRSWPGRAMPYLFDYLGRH